MRKIYNRQIEIGKFSSNDLDYTIKWSDTLKSKLKRKIGLSFDKGKIVKSAYRPFFGKYYYSEKGMSDRLTDNHYQSFDENLNSYNFPINL